MAVYYDNLYRTFLFAPAEGTAAVTGWVHSKSGLPVDSKEVVVYDERGTPHRGITNASGEFRIFGEPAGGLTLTVDKVTLSIKDPHQKIEVALP
jgi:hypothetical protein